MNIFNFRLLLASSLSFAFSSFVFSKTDIKVIQSLTEHFHVGFCVIEKESSDHIWGSILEKIYPAQNRLLTVSLNFAEISDLINKEMNNENYNFAYNVPKTMVVLKMSEESIEMLEKFSQEENITSMFTWIMFSDGHFQARDFQSVYVPFDCEFIYIHRTQEHYNMTELYRIKKESELESHYLGNWTKSTGLSLVNLSFYKRRNSLKGHTLIGALKNNPPYVEIVAREKDRPIFRGYFFEIWRELEFRLNFTTQFPVELFDKDFRRILRRREAEFFLGRLPFTSKFSAFADYVQPQIEARYYAFGHRRGGELDWDSYLKPFSTNIWISCLAWVITSSFALTIFYRIAWITKISERESRYFTFTPSECVLTVFRAICMQGSDVTPKSYSCRLIFLSIYVTAYVVTSAFSAALFAILTVPKPKSHFNSLSELFSNRSYEIVFPSDPAFQRAFGGFSNFLWVTETTLKERLMESSFKLHLNSAEGLQRICEDKFLIFIYDMPNVLYLLQNMTIFCRNRIVSLDKPLLSEYISIGFRKNSPYKKIINFHLTRLRNEGISNRIYLNTWPPRIPRIRTHWSEATISDVSPVLCLFAIGSFIGFLVFTAEKLIRFIRMKRNEKHVKLHLEHGFFFYYD